MNKQIIKIISGILLCAGLVIGCSYAAISLMESNRPDLPQPEARNNDCTITLYYGRGLGGSKRWVSNGPIQWTGNKTGVYFVDKKSNLYTYVVGDIVVTHE